MVAPDKKRCGHGYENLEGCPCYKTGAEAQLADIEAENARLQKQEHDDVLALKRMQNRLTLMVAERNGLASQLLDVQQDSIRHVQERDRYEALAERAIQRGVWLWHYTWKRHLFMLGAEVERTDRAEALAEEAQQKLQYLCTYLYMTGLTDGKFWGPIKWSVDKRFTEMEEAIHRALIHLETSAASVGAARAKLMEDGCQE